jgi:hypothetical protein
MLSWLGAAVALPTLTQRPRPLPAEPETERVEAQFPARFAVRQHHQPDAPRRQRRQHPVPPRRIVPGMVDEPLAARRQAFEGLAQPELAALE